MLIIGCDYHPSFQQIAFVDTETGECGERKLTHKEEAESFYRDLNGCTLRVGMEATWHARWFERLLAELNFELWIGDPAEIRARRVRKQKNDRLDAEHLLQLLVEDRFPQIWVPSPENRDLRQLLWHRHQLQAIALNEGIRLKKGLWSKLGRVQLDRSRWPRGVRGDGKIYWSCWTDSTRRSTNSAQRLSKPRNNCQRCNG